MTKLEYISNNCIQCAKDLDECHCLVLGVQEFASFITDRSSLFHEFTHNGVNFLLHEDKIDAPPPKVIASIFVTDLLDPHGEGLCIKLGDYIRFIPRCELKNVSLESVTSEVYGSIKVTYPKVFHHRRVTVDITPYFIGAFIGCAIAYVIWLCFSC